MYKNIFKRVIDVVLSLLICIALSSVILAVSILVRIKLGSPVIFRQQRPGLNERVFTIYKFRTMTDKKDKNGSLLSDEFRLTRFGMFLRKTSLDELPELFNIIKGDMSFVGPRPLLVRYLPYFTENERIRSHVRPGITGLAQVNGRNALNWTERFQLDVDYVQNMSFLLDIKILVKTIFVTLKHEDILVGKEHVMLDLDVEREKIYNNE